MTDVNMVITGRNIYHIVRGTLQVMSPVEIPFPDGFDVVMPFINSYID